MLLTRSLTAYAPFGEISLIRHFTATVVLFGLLQAVIPSNVMSQESTAEFSISLSEQQLITAHCFLEGCTEAFDAIPVLGPIVKGGSKAGLSLLLPSEESATRRAIQINHEKLLTQLGTVNTRLMDIASSIDEIRESVEAAPEQELYVDCRTLYSQLVDSPATAGQMEATIRELETRVYNASHMLELRPRGLVFYLAVSNASLSLNYLQEASVRLKVSEEQQKKLKVVSARIDQILNTCSSKGSYSPDNCQELWKRYNDCRATSRRLLEEAGLSEAATSDAFAVNRFAFSGREPDGKPDIEYSILRFSREEKWKFKSSTYGLTVNGGLVKTRSGFESFEPVSMTGFTSGTPESPVSTIEIDSEGDQAKRTLEDRVRERIEAYNDSLDATNQSCAACVVAEAAKKLVEMNKKALTTSYTGR